MALQRPTKVFDGCVTLLAQSVYRGKSLPSSRGCEMHSRKFLYGLHSSQPVAVPGYLKEFYIQADEERPQQIFIPMIS